MTQKIKKAQNLATMRQITVRSLSDKKLSKQFKQISKVAEDDAWVNEFLAFSRPSPVGGEYILQPYEVKLILEDIYGAGSDMENLRLQDDEPEDRSAYSRQELNSMEGKRRQRDPSRWAAVRPRKIKLGWTYVPGVQQAIGGLPKEVITDSTVGLRGGSASYDFQDVWVSGGSTAYDSHY